MTRCLSTSSSFDPTAMALCDTSLPSSGWSKTTRRWNHWDSVQTTGPNSGWKERHWLWWRVRTLSLKKQNKNKNKGKKSLQNKKNLFVFGFLKCGGILFSVSTMTHFFDIPLFKTKLNLSLFLGCRLFIYYNFGQFWLISIM